MYPVGWRVFWWILQNWRQLPRLARAYYTHFMQCI
nr:MAG TPA: hypothetical protein [Bacteriophage sp.]